MRNGFNDWEAVKDFNGSSAVTINEVNALGVVIVELDESPNGNTNNFGSANPCTGLVALNPNKLNTSTKWEHWARHEMGHMLGLEHTGDDDSFGGGHETMATCWNPSGATTPSQDDYGNLLHKQGALNPETIHANPSFEQGTSFWGTSSIASFYTSTASPEDGAQSARMRPSSNWGYIFQTMNYTAAGGKKIDARTNHRKLSSSATSGSVELQIYVRQVNYQSNPSCSYPSNRNENVRTSVGGWTKVRSQLSTPTTSWKILTESTLYTVPFWNAADVRVRVASNVKYTSSGSFATLAIDTTRARDRS